MQGSDLKQLIEEALRFGRFSQAARLAAEIDDVGLRETWFERVLDAHETYQERQHLLEYASDPTDWFIPRLHGNHRWLPTPIYYKT